MHRLRSAIIGGLAMALANLTAGAVLAPQPAGAAVTMSAAAAGCTVTATVSGLPTEGSWYVANAAKDSVEVETAVAVLPAPATPGSPTSVELTVWPGAGTLYLYPVITSTAGQTAGVLMTTVDYTADCVPPPFRFVPTAEVNLGSLPADGSPLRLVFAWDSAGTDYLNNCIVEAAGPVIDGEVVLPAGEAVPGTCRLDLAGMDTPTLDSTTFGPESWAVETNDVSLQCEEVCTLSATLGEVAGPNFGTEFDAELVLDGVQGLWPPGSTFDVLDITAFGADPAVNCQFTVNGPSSVSGTVSGSCWVDEEATVPLSAMNSGSILVAGTGESGYVVLDSTFDAVCTDDPMFCTLRFAPAKPVPISGPAQPTPVGPNYTG